jgi:hypothetical protein
MIKIVKLVTGEDLIANVIESHTLNSCSLQDPMSFYLDYRNNNSLIMQHYLSMNIINYHWCLTMQN